MPESMWAEMPMLRRLLRSMECTLTREETNEKPETGAARRGDDGPGGPWNILRPVKTRQYGRFSTGE